LALNDLKENDGSYGRPYRHHHKFEVFAIYGEANPAEPKEDRKNLR